MSMKIDMQLILKETGRSYPSSATNFTAYLLRLIFKADRRNKALLRTVYPNAVQVVEHYQDTGVILDLEYD